MKLFVFAFLMMALDCGGNVAIQDAGEECDAGACSMTSDCPLPASDPCVIARCHGSQVASPAPTGCCVYVRAHGSGCP